MSLAVYPNAVRGLTWPVMKTHEFSTTLQESPNKYAVPILNTQNPVWHFTLIYEYLKNNMADLVASLSPYTDYEYLRGFLLSNQGQFASFLFDDIYDDSIGMFSLPGGTATRPSMWRASPANTQNPVVFPTGSYVLDTSPTPHLQKASVGGVPGTSVPAWNTGGGNATDNQITWADQGVFSGANAQAIPLVNNGAAYYSPIQRNFGGQFLEDVTDLNTSVYALKVWANGTLQTVTTNYTIQGPGLSIPGYSYMGMYLQWVGTPTPPITVAVPFYFRVRLESDSQDIEQFMQLLWTIGGQKSKNGSGMLKLQSARPVAL